MGHALSDTKLGNTKPVNRDADVMWLFWIRRQAVVHLPPIILKLPCQEWDEEFDVKWVKITDPVTRSLEQGRAPALSHRTRHGHLACIPLLRGRTLYKEIAFEAVER